MAQTEFRDLHRERMNLESPGIVSPIEWECF